MIVAAAPAIVTSQSGRANEPWYDPWSGPWPALLDRPGSVDPELAALQLRIDASLQRLMKSSAEAGLTGARQADFDAPPRLVSSQIAER